MREVAACVEYVCLRGGLSLGIGSGDLQRQAGRVGHVMFVEVTCRSDPPRPSRRRPESHPACLFVMLW